VIAKTFPFFGESRCFLFIPVDPILQISLPHVSPMASCLWTKLRKFEVAMGPLAFAGGICFPAEMIVPFFFNQKRPCQTSFLTVESCFLLARPNPLIGVPGWPDLDGFFSHLLAAVWFICVAERGTFLCHAPFPPPVYLGFWSIRQSSP